VGIDRALNLFHNSPMIHIRNKSGQIIYTLEVSSDLGFFQADLKGANLKDAVLDGANFSGADLSRACLEDCDLYWAVFFEANLQHANLQSALLAGCDFKGANLTHADLRNANLGLDNLGGATELHGANLTACKVEGAIFAGAQYDSETVFPDGFDPVDHGMVLVSSS